MERVHLTEEKETLLITLYARALESKSEKPILRDVYAEELIRRIDYDFDRLKITPDDLVTASIRAGQLDKWTAEFMQSRPNSLILHLGCGLDSRVFRVDPPAGVQWFDVDYPEVIDLRRRLYPERAAYQMIPTSVTESDWFDLIHHNKPTLIVAEGLMMYLAETEVRQLLDHVVARFPGGELIFDAFNQYGVRMATRHRGMKVTQACVKWGIDDPLDLEKWNPRLKFMDEVAFTDAPGIGKLPFWQKTAIRLTRFLPSIRRVHRLLRYRF